ncbi:P-loop NTPase fold protein [uncultured Draconibacterium sp.]|uniref:KAP family P-loop NTPase fold protein n=1 Tax=uncultured Draconibacterium sp. TaxID=1573823 RepID=UPI002AA6D5F3|nr:P-loop NTPase fold protein [uncultured Draconibacterium sp.]
MKLPKSVSKLFQNSNKASIILMSFAIYILFHTFFEEVINKHLVETIISKLETGTSNDLMFLSFAVIIIISTVNRVSINYFLSKQTILLNLALLLVFLYYRISLSYWEFTSFKTIGFLKYIDVVLLFFCSNILVAIFHKKREYQTIPNKGFCFDNPIENEESDKLNRNSVAIIIAEKIKNTANKSSSFAIGVNSEWGWGKTSFLNLIKNNLKEKNQVVLHFNPWLNNDEKAIVASFFDILSSRLKQYDKNLSHDLIEYGRTINSIYPNKGLETLNKAFSVFQDSKDLRERYENINESIKASGLQIIIFIDDLDRLFENEVSEVLKLIRNTANFSNTVFVVAYDRNYLISALKRTNDYHPEFYLEKIFQFELALPAFDRDVIVNKLEELLNPHLVDSDKEELKKVLKRAKDPNSIFDGNTFNLDLLINLRDVNRFVNSFITSYEALRGEVVLEDLLNTELLKVKYLGVYQLISNKYDRFLEAEYLKDHNYLTLKKKRDEQDNVLDETVLKDYLDVNHKEVGIQESQIENAIAYVYNIFPSHSIYSSVTPQLLSISNPISINRYFHYNLLKSDLSEIEFSNSRNKTKVDFVADIKGWLDDGFENEVSRRLNDINFFANSKDYEKIMAAIFFYSNYTPANRESGLTFDYQNLLNKLDYKKVKNFYAENELQQFVCKLFKNEESPYLYISGFLDYIFEYEGITEWKFIIPRADLIKLKIGFFKKYCENASTFDRNVFYLFHYCRYKEYQAVGGSTYQSFWVLPQEAKDIFKDTANRLLQSFFKNIISTNPRLIGGKQLFSLVKSLEMAWDDWGNFESFIYDLEETEELAEFKSFYEKCKNVNFNNYVEFKFDKIDLTDALLFNN